MKTKLVVLSLSLILLVQAPLGMAQGTQLSSDQAWALVKQTPLGDTLEVRLKTGETVNGEMILASDTELSLSIKQQTRQLKRDGLREVRRILPPNPDKQKLYAGIGAGIGLMAGLSLSVSQSERYCGDCRGTRTGLLAALVGLPIAGSLIGRKLGGRGKRIVIYQAP